jgi:hypothetical protein
MVDTSLHSDERSAMAAKGHVYRDPGKTALRNSIAAASARAEEETYTMRHARRSTITAALIVVVMTAGAPAWAEEEQYPDRFMLRLGGYQVRDADTIVRLETNTQSGGAYLDFNETLGGETSTTVLRMDGLYRFNERHGIGIGWYALKFTGSKALEKDINWAGKFYPAGTQVDSQVKFGIYKLGYQYSLFHNDKAELGASFGFHIMRTATSVVAQGINQSGGKSMTAPLPVWGMFAEYRFTPRFSAYYSYQFFFVNFQDQNRGAIQDFLFGLEYRLFRNAAVGAAYNRFGMQLEAKRDPATMSFVTNWNGGMLYGAVYF